MPPTCLASWGWLSFNCMRRSRTRSPMVFIRSTLQANRGLHKMSCSTIVQDCLLTSCKRTCYAPAMETGIGALKRAIAAHLGSQAAAARCVGVTPQAVSEILRRGKRVPAEWCLRLEQATGGAVTAHDLRPDLYPPILYPKGET